MKEHTPDYLSRKALRDKRTAEATLAAAGIEASVGLRDAKLGGAVIHVVHAEQLEAAQTLNPKAEVEVAPDIRNDDW